MATKPISTITPAHLQSTDSIVTIDIGNKTRKVTQLPADPMAVLLAKQLPRPTLVASNTSTKDSEELLREMGRKTFHYKNSLAPTEVVNWKEKTDRELDIFVKKASMLAIVNLMDSNIDGTQVLEIVNETCTTHRSVLDVYMEKAGHKRSFLYRLRARLNYFFYFHCNIIPNTLNSFMQSFLNKTRIELVQKDGGKNITTLINQLLIEASSFLDLYLQSTENYAKGIDLQGSRDTHISYELSKKHGMSVEEVCRKFALTAVRKFLPHVPFFQGWKNSSWRLLRLVGGIFDHTLGWVLNRTLRKALQIKIPSVIQSIVMTSIDATQPSNLPFVVAITQGILEQLRKFKTQIDRAEYSSPEAVSVSVAGTEKLPEVIKKFIEVLSLEPLETRKELQQSAKKNSCFDILSPEIDKNIEESCIDGCRLFLSYLSNPNNSEEIFSLLLNLTNATFDSKPEDLKTLQIKYDALREQMRRESREVFQTVIKRSVTEHVQGPPESRTQQIAMNFEVLHRFRALDTVRQLLIDDQSIQSKLETFQQNSPHQPDDLINIANELDSMNEAIEGYQSLAVLNDTKKIPAAIRQGIQQGIDKAMLPIFRNMNALLDRLTYAKKLQKHLLEDVSFYQELHKLDALLGNSKDFKISEYKQTLERLHMLCSKMESDHSAFDKCLSELNGTSEELAIESQALKSLLSLDQKDGLLPKLFHAVKARIDGRSVSFRWKDLQEIPEIQNLPLNERKELHACIQSVGSCYRADQMELTWGELKEKMTYLFNSHRLRQNKLLSKNSRWSQQYLQSIEITKNSLQQDLTQSTQEISKIIQTLAQSSSEIRIRKVEAIPSRVVSALGGLPAVIGAATGAALSASALYLPGAISCPILGFLGVFTGGVLSWYGGSKGKQLAIINTIAGTAICCATNVHPAIPILVGTAGGYWEGKKLQNEALPHICDQVVFPPVIEVFDHLYDFILKPHVWKWAIIDSLKCVHEACL